ncbi:hypothetical protein HOY80DRAFT_1041616 [Tuber brumale]|nr:hypothetical protein HOY80DRAFT_1041616 [Tuber brumale]
MPTPPPPPVELTPRPQHYHANLQVREQCVRDILHRVRDNAWLNKRWPTDLHLLAAASGGFAQGLENQLIAFQVGAMRNQSPKFLTFGPTGFKLYWPGEVGPFQTIIAHIYNHPQYPLQSLVNAGICSTHLGRIGNIRAISRRNLEGEGHTIRSLRRKMVYLGNRELNTLEPRPSGLAEGAFSNRGGPFVKPCPGIRHLEINTRSPD